MRKCRVRSWEMVHDQNRGSDSYVLYRRAGGPRITKQTYLYVFLALTILIWGNSFVVVQIAINDGASPIMIAMARFLVASSIFGVYFLVKRPKRPETPDLRKFVFLAFIGVGIYYVLQYYGVKLGA